MFSKPTFTNRDRIDSLIGAGTKVQGDIVFVGGLRIDGEVEGNITAAPEGSGTLVISEKARIEGGISVSRVLVNGTVVGPISSTGLLELQPKAKVSGDVAYNRIEMHLGAVIEGRMARMDGSEKAVELTLTGPQIGMASSEDRRWK